MRTMKPVEIDAVVVFDVVDDVDEVVAKIQGFE